MLFLIRGIFVTPYYGKLLVQIELIGWRNLTILDDKQNYHSIDHRSMDQVFQYSG